MRNNSHAPPQRVRDQVAALGGRAEGYTVLVCTPAVYRSLVQREELHDLPVRGLPCRVCLSAAECLEAAAEEARRGERPAVVTG